MPGSFLPLSSREEREWLAFESVYGPMTPDRHDAYLEQIAMVLTNVHRDPDKRKAAYTAEEVFGRFDQGIGKPEHEIDEAPIAAIGLAKALGAEEQRPGQAGA